MGSVQPAFIGLLHQVRVMSLTHGKTFTLTFDMYSAAAEWHIKPCLCKEAMSLPWCCSWCGPRLKVIGRPVSGAVGCPATQGRRSRGSKFSETAVELMPRSHWAQQLILDVPCRLFPSLGTRLRVPMYAFIMYIYIYICIHFRQTKVFAC